VSNTNAGIYVASNSKIGGSTFLRTHLGFEAYGILLDHNTNLGGCLFLQTQWEGVGNADLMDTDGSSSVFGNVFMSNSGWGGRYAGYAIHGKPISPSLQCGWFSGNIIDCSAAMGPTPGDANFVHESYGNTWTIDTSILSQIITGQIPPATCPESYANRVSVGTGADVQLIPCQTAVMALSPVGYGAGRVPGIVPVAASTTPTAPVGEALSAATPGQLVFVAPVGKVEALLGANWPRITVTAPQ
jgi:hypothetical protein